MVFLNRGHSPNTNSLKMSNYDLNIIASTIASPSTSCTFIAGTFDGQFRIKPIIPNKNVDQIILCMNPATTEYNVPPNTKLVLSGRRIGTLEFEARIHARTELGRAAYNIANKIIENNKDASIAIRALFKNLNVTPFTFDNIHQGGYVDKIYINGDKDKLYSALAEIKIRLTNETTLNGRIYLERLNTKDKDGNMIYKISSSIITANDTPISMSEIRINQQFAHALVSQLSKLKSSAVILDLSKATI